MATVGSLNAMVTVGVKGVEDVRGLTSAYDKLKRAQERLAEGPTRVDAGMLAGIRNQNDLLNRIGLNAPGRFSTDITSENSAFNQLPENFANLSAKAQAAEYRMRSFGNTSADSQEKFRKMNLIFQQSGYQIQDLVVQIMSGQNALMAIGQQGSQLASFFGRAGPWIGVGVSLATVAAMLWQTHDATKAAKEEAKKYADELERIGNFRMQSFRAGMTSTEQRDADIQAMLLDRSDVEKQQKLVDELKAQQADLTNPDVTRNRGDARTNLIARARVARELAQAEIDLKAAQERLYKSEPAGIRAQREKEADAARETVEQAVAAAKVQSDSLRERIEAGNRAFMLEQKAAEERKKEAESIRDQLDPMRLRIREQERLNELVAKGALLMSEAQAYLDAQASKTILGLQSRLPQSLQVNTGASSLGGVVGNGGGNDVQQGILAAIRELVMLTRMDMTVNGVN